MEELSTLPDHTLEDMLMLQMKGVMWVGYVWSLRCNMLGSEVTLPALMLMLASTMHHILHGLGKDMTNCSVAYGSICSMAGYISVAGPLTQY